MELISSFRIVTYAGQKWGETLLFPDLWDSLCLGLSVTVFRHQSGLSEHTSHMPELLIL